MPAVTNNRAGKKIIRKSVFFFLAKEGFLQTNLQKRSYTFDTTSIIKVNYFISFFINLKLLAAVTLSVYSPAANCCVGISKYSDPLYKVNSFE